MTSKDPILLAENAGVDDALTNRAIFNSFIYTPWRQALEELEKRQDNAALDEYLAKVMPDGLPPGMSGAKNAVLFRHIATTNYEIQRFMMVADSMDSLEARIFEYGEDKFNDRNEAKYFLGKLCFHKGSNKNREPIWESVRVIDFNGSNNKPLSAVRTVWGEPLIDFHHDLFRRSFPHHAQCMTDISAWLRSFGAGAKHYYKPFLSLFLRNGVLFENFLLEKDEFGFTQQVIIPTILEIEKESGLKPLIVALEPTEIEGSQFWWSHPLKDKQLVDEKMASTPAMLPA